MIKALRSIDRHLWSIPLLAFGVTELVLSVWSAESHRPVLLAAPPQAARQQVYASLTGSSSALLGLALAAVAILVAFGPRLSRTGGQTQNEKSLARAREGLIGSLLVAAFFLLVVLITATLALAVDPRHAGNSVLTTIIEGSGVASVLGLLVSGLGLALVIAERSRQ
jgi:hypothetical protein